MTLDDRRDSWTVSRRSALGLLGAATAGAAVAGNATAAAAGPPGPPAPAPDVTLVDNGATVTLSNGIVTAVVDKATAATTDLRLVASVHGNEAFNVFSGRNGHGYSEFDYTVGTTTYRKAMTAAVYRVVSETADRVEIAMIVDDPANLPFVADLHVVLERGASGLYYFFVCGYPAQMPDALTIGQLRYAFAAGDPSFRYFVVDDHRGVQQRPTAAETAAWTTVQDTTYVLPDGRLYSKYQNISDLEGDNHVFLCSNGSLALSLIQPSKEAFNGGPTKQELTVHDYYDGEILLWHPFTSHYGSPSMKPPKGWEKIYGPFFLSLEETGGADPAVDDPERNVAELWDRAKARAARERRAWPYRWMTHPLYQLQERTTVTGRLRIRGHASRGAWVLLSPTPEWQYESFGYVYAGRADALGGFELAGVRPGTYWLAAFTDGVLGEHRQQVTIPAPVGRGQHRLGNVDWVPASHGRVLWQIGTPDRSAEEFYVHGGEDGFRKNMDWLEYPYEFPGGVDFTIGRDDPRTAWNYFHPCYRTPGTPLQLSLRGTTPDLTLESWKIRFRSHGYRRGLATLEIALASSVFGTLKVNLNGTDLAAVDPLPGPPGDNGSYRLAVRSMYRQLDPIVFPAASIVAGENVITLSPVRAPVAPLTPAGKVDNWMEPMAGVMYDVIRLSVDGR